MTSVDHAGSGTRPICFAGIRTQWTSVRKVKEGETTNDLFAERNVAVELTKGFLNSARSIDVGRKAYGCRERRRHRIRWKLLAWYASCVPFYGNGACSYASQTRFLGNR
jgi:hypothetical protein